MIAAAQVANYKKLFDVAKECKRMFIDKPTLPLFAKLLPWIGGFGHFTHAYRLHAPVGHETWSSWMKI